IAITGRLAALFDFENKKVFFPDIHASFKFCALVFGGAQRQFDVARCAFYLHAVSELAAADVPDDADDTSRLRATRVIELSADDFRAVNPNTGTAPIFRNALDARLTTRIYRTHPVLVRHVFAEVTDPITKETSLDPDRIAGEQRLYPVRYLRMFDMTNDSGLFKRRDELEAEGFYPVADGRWKKGDTEMLPLYEGKMVQRYDHRAANVVINPENLHRPAVTEPATEEQHADPDWLPQPQFWIAQDDVIANEPGLSWSIGFKDVTAPTNARTMIAAIVPEAGLGNTLPAILRGADSGCTFAEKAPALLANLNSLAYDYLARQKVQGQHLNWFIVEQLPLIAPDAYAQPLGAITVSDFVRGEVLRLSYTAHDLGAFARDLGYAGAPFAWDAEDRRHRMARLDALYFRLYGLDRDEA
ncbi:MAG: Eco57I restriction-modification methylase domain-containing protein, partial [Vulcanimicrobiaceae bacterium]